MLVKGDWLASLDQVMLMFPSCQPTGHIEGLPKKIQVKVLPFDLSTVPRVFTMTLAIIVHLFHNQGSMRFHSMTIHLPLDGAQELSIFALFKLPVIAGKIILCLSGLMAAVS